MNRLPTELLLLIGEHIHDLPTKRALSECSRGFQRVFQPLLYVSITLCPRRSIPAIVQNLYRHPHLASHVRHVTFGLGYHCEFRNRHHKSEHGHGIDSALMKRMLNETFAAKTEKARWKKYLSRLCAVAWMGLLLTRLSRLETLRLAYDHDQLLQDILEKAVIRQRPFHNAPPFPFLREVMIGSLTGYRPVTTDLALPFYYFPAVREVLVCNIQERLVQQSRRSLDQLTVGSPTCQVTRAGATMGAFDPIGMTKWIKMCPKLEHFHVVLDYSPDLHRGHFDTKAFRLSLLQVKETLKSLRLGFMRTASDKFEFQSAAMVQYDLYDLLGSLKEFSVLQQLSIPHSSFTRLKINNSGSFAGVLPRSLEVLEITGVVVGCSTYIVSDLEDLVRYRNHFVPQLRRIVLKIGPMVAQILCAAILRFACEGAGVMFDIQGPDF